MKILFSIILNATILFAITWLLSGNNQLGVPNGVILGCGDCGVFSPDAIKTYLIGGILLGIMNVTIRPLLKLLSLPLFFLFFGLVVFFVNGVLLALFSYIMNDILAIDNISFAIEGWINFAIAVAIFTVLNTIYALIFAKK